MVLFVLAILYSGYSIVLEWPDLKKMMQVTMTMTITFQGILRFVCYIFDQKTCSEIQSSIVKFYEECDESVDKIKTIIATNTKSLRKAFAVVFAVHVVCEFLPFIISLYGFVFNGKMVPPLPVFVPFVQRDSLTSFCINFMLHLFMAAMMTMGHPEFDWTYIVIVTHTKAHVDGIAYELDQMSALVQDKTKENSAKNEKIIKKQFVELIEKHRMFIVYFKLASKFIGKQFFVLISMNIYVICSSGIALLTSDFSAAIGMAILYPIQILFVCIMGEFVKHQHERLNALLWDFDWFGLSVKHQKIYKFFLQNVQQPMRFEWPFIGVANLELYITVRTCLYRN